ncbi:hypothetical protein FHR99_002478 [Litorivivens lipolytica]|uniref:Uncharacterized protein n=1 Tax=Litorivivens lipolytica TaxID=1524264 RepID=A0A7W4W696_9GAMM|nr:hypothetical protein [Litorivivens lipolytica]MBB3048204.1 hypothetical protein [Litorivivens lipolytica]
MNSNNKAHPFKVKLGFSSAADVVRDGRQGLRIPTRYGVDGSGGATETHWCDATDLAEDRSKIPGLSAGFDQIDLSGRENLQDVLAKVREAGELSDEHARLVRSEIQGKRFRLSDGRRLRVLFVAPEGFIMRRSGPNGLDVSSGQAMTERNGHKAADQVHGDQNVYGTPLKQMLKGAAPWLFRHNTLGRRNRLSPVCLLNLWLPLQQCTQPLTLADRRTVDVATQQLHYALPTGDFLDRNEDQALNDIWLFLHDRQQHWYCDSAMNSERAYVFETLGAPHGAATLPGEDIAESCYLALEKLELQIKAGEDVEPITPLPDLPPETPSSLRSVLEEADLLFSKAGGQASDLIVEHARALRQRLTRQSLEMRLVALVY